MVAIAAAAAHGGGAPSGTLVILIVGFLAGVFVGANIGRRRALRHLGQAEYNTRWKTIRGISRW